MKRERDVIQYSNIILSRLRMKLKLDEPKFG